MAALSRSDLLDALARVQASPDYLGTDILLFARAAPYETVADHLMVCARRLPRDDYRQILAFLRSRAFLRPEPRPEWTPRAKCIGMPVLALRNRRAA